MRAGVDKSENQGEQRTLKVTRRTQETQNYGREIDYYLEDGLFVFTAKFLLRRGYCCESGCRHCPYEKPNP